MAFFTFALFIIRVKVGICVFVVIYLRNAGQTDGSVNDTVFNYWSVCILLFHLTVESVERESEENLCKTTEMF